MSGVVGVDGTRDGWIAIRLIDGVIAGGQAYRAISSLLQSETGWIVAIDIPIGLPTVEAWPRAADVQAAAMIGPRRSSVFRVPPREALLMPYGDAQSLCQKLGIGGFSRQAYELRHKILEVEPHVGDSRVREIHPEVSFSAMAGRPLRYSKRTWNGYRERVALLAMAGLELREELGDLGRAAVDDVLDAVAAAWSAQRVAEGRGQSLPPGASPGEPAIWY